jgi:hypothetical protein
MSCDISVRERTSRDHLGVETRAWRKQPMKVPTLAIGNIDHRRDT